MRWFCLFAPTLALAQSPDLIRAALEKQQSAATQQRESIRKQTEKMGLRLVPGAPLIVALDPASVPAPTDTCDPIAESIIAPIINTAAKAHDIQPKLLRAVIEQESAFRPCAVSPKGAQGLMQIMPDTAADLALEDPFDPQKNVDAGARYLKQLIDKYKDVAQALGAYNAGPTAVDQAGGIPKIKETRDYVDAILRKTGNPRDGPDK